MKTDKNQKKTTVTEVYIGSSAIVHNLFLFGSEIVTEQINEAFLLES